MSDRTRPMSRRALLVAMAAMPMASVALTAEESLDIDTCAGSDAHVQAIMKQQWRFVKAGVHMVKPSLRVDKKDTRERACALSGEIIKANKGEFDPKGNDKNAHKTNICAFMCGYQAARFTLEADPDATGITPAMYERGWKETKRIMGSSLSRYRRIQANKGDDTEAVPFYGYGC